MAGHERKRVGLTVRLEPSLLREIRRRAKADHKRPIGSMIRILLRQALDLAEARA